MAAAAQDEEGPMDRITVVSCDCHAAAPPEIYRVDPADGSVLARVPLPGLPLADDGGMGFDDSTGLLYLSYGSFLYVANPTTGASIPLGPTPARTALEVIGPCDPPPPRFRPRSPLPSVLLFWRW